MHYFTQSSPVRKCVFWNRQREWPFHTVTLWLNKSSYMLGFFTNTLWGCNWQHKQPLCLLKGKKCSDKRASLQHVCSCTWLEARLTNTATQCLNANQNMMGCFWQIQFWQHGKLICTFLFRTHSSTILCISSWRTKSQKDSILSAKLQAATWHSFFANT
jgi:hypothetical protein